MIPCACSAAEAVWEGGLFGAPLVDAPDGCDIVFAGLCGELDRTARPGARAGAAYLRTYPVDGMAQNIRTGDCGDLVVSGGVEEAERQIQEFCGTVLTAGAVPCLIGGDDATAYGQLRACAEAYGPVGVLHLGGELSETLLRAAESGFCRANACLDVGARSGFAARYERMRRAGVACLTAAALDEQGLEYAGARVRDVLKQMPVMVLLDVNFLDPVYVPAAAKPYSGGFAVEETEDFLEICLRELDVRAVAAYGWLDHPDPGALSLLNVSAALSALFRLVSSGKPESEKKPSAERMA